MREKLSNFILQVKSRNGEHEQAVLRVVFTSTLFVYLFLSRGTNPDQASISVLDFLAAYTFLSVLLILFLLARPTESRIRIFSSIIFDVGATTFAMLVTRENGAIFYGIYLWVIVGNGLRYGSQALLLSYAASLAGFVSVAFLNSYWSSHPRLTVALFIPLFLVPLYILKLRNQLNQAIETSKEANKAKSHFLAHMSHEMRTPLNGIIGANDLLTATTLNSEQRDLANTLENSSRILKQMIDNVLDISKIESGKLISEKVEFDLHELVNNTITMFSTQANEKGLRLIARFTPETPFALRGDTQHLLQVIVNLLGNAIKFTHIGNVELRISTVSQDPAHALIRFEIIDTGIGIATEAQHSIFERFTQADSSITLKYGGSGLGTTISRDLVKLMGGQIGLQSQLGIGSIFWFDLPLAKQISGFSADIPMSLEQLQVISIGLGHTNRVTLANHLASWNVRFQHEESLPNFFSSLMQLQAQQKTGVVVMCDPQSIGMDSEEFSRHISENSQNSKVSLILLDADAQHDTGDDSLVNGYNCRLRLPLDKTLLFNALHSITAPRPLSGVISFKEHYERNRLNKSGIRILVADDNGTNRKIISKILEHGGHIVELAEDGEQALDALENQHFDLMILDMNMPLMGGLEVVKIHRAINRSAPVPVVILTANATVAAKRECEVAEVDAYLTKPVNAITLLDAVARLTATANQIDVTEFPSSLQNEEHADHTILINENTLHQLELLGEGQEDFLTGVIHGFIAETEKLLSAMQTALSNKDYATFKDLAHIVKGSAGNVGGEALHLMCRDIMLSSLPELQNKADESLKQVHSCFMSTKILLIKHLEYPFHNSM